VNQLCILVQSLHHAAHYLAFGKVDVKPNSVFGLICLREDVVFGLPMVGPLERALASRDSEGIKIEVSRLDPDLRVVRGSVTIGRKEEGSIATTGLGAAMFLILTPLFVEFYESYRDWLYHHFKRDIERWPPEWRFGRVIRNACSHGGAIKIDPKKKESPVHWRGLTYSASDSGKAVLD
jgi:hypothetical protein